MKRSVVLVLALMVIGFVTQPPPTARAVAWQITPFAGNTWFEHVDLAPSMPDQSLKNAPYGGLRLGTRLYKMLGFQLAGGFTPTSVDVTDGPDVNFWHAAGALTVTPIDFDWGDVYVLAGGGYSNTKLKGADAVASGTFEAGGGLHWWFRPGIGLNLEARNILLTKNDLEGSKENHAVVGAGLTFGFGGGIRDADADGVADRDDKCPGTALGVRVDATGCPTDQDGDGVFDGLDQCADTPKGATVTATGCPSDADADGVFDGLDQCGETPRGATVNATGCPIDSDGDGVFDGLDQCANTLKGAMVDGKGCPTDEDGDGVVDGIDKCPATAAGLKVDVDGCPIEVTEKETELLDTGMIRLEDVNFETGKAEILPASYPQLDVAGAVLRKWPDLKVQIGGHTDSRGAANTNQTLSEARAQAVMNYLTSKYPELKPEQFTSVGFGESKPLVPNTSVENMAKNRRVEFKVLNRDVLKREVERRKMLQK